jgi:RNA polymerase sigma factor (sigma-70 family)
VRRLLAQPLEYRVCVGFKRLHVLTHEFHQPIVPDYARDVSERTLLSQEQEGDLLVRMNYCKFRADILRRQLPRGGNEGRDHVLRGLTPPARQMEETLAEIESCLAAAIELRDCLLRAFLKLAISLIGRFVSRQHGFDELLSEAAMALLRAVEKFDPDRGFRFSTYATPAVRRQLERFILKDHQDRRQMVRTAHLDTLPAAGGPTRADDRRRQAAVTEMAGMLQRLDAREQTILQARFGLEPGSEPQSLQEVAGRLGVCRERVRQLEARALERLRDMPEAARLTT